MVGQCGTGDLISAIEEGCCHSHSAFNQFVTTGTGTFDSDFFNVVISADTS